MRRGRSESENAPREVGTPPTCRTARPATPRSRAVPARTRSALPQRARVGGCRRSPPLRRLAFGAAGGLIARRRGAKSSSPTPLAACEPRHPAEAVSYAGVPPYAGSVHANAALWPQHDPRGYVGGVGRAHEAHATRRPAQRPGQQLAVDRFCRGKVVLQQFTRLRLLPERFPSRGQECSLEPQFVISSPQLVALDGRRACCHRALPRAQRAALSAPRARRRRRQAACACPAAAATRSPA